MRTALSSPYAWHETSRCCLICAARRSQSRCALFGCYIAFPTAVGFLMDGIVESHLITPTGDPGNMLVIAAPMVALCVVGIGVAWVFGRRRQPV